MNYKRRLLSLILLCSASSLHAETRWFEIELLLFQRNSDINSGKEDMVKPDIVVDTRGSIPLLKAGSTPRTTPTNSSFFAQQLNGFNYLSEAQLQLSAERTKLQQHASFKPLLHLGWRMPVKSPNSAVPIRIFAGENYASNKSITADTLLASQPLPTDLIIESQNTDQITAMDSGEKWAIDGNFKVYLDHYLFIDSQLIIRQMVTENVAEIITQEPTFEIIQDENNVQVIRQNDNLATQQYRQQRVIKTALFDQSRRLRSGEIHYFDNPLMGMIVQIRKIPEISEQ